MRKSSDEFEMRSEGEHCQPIYMFVERSILLDTYHVNELVTYLRFKIDADWCGFARRYKLTGLFGMP